VWVVLSIELATQLAKTFGNPAGLPRTALRETARGLPRLVANCLVSSRETFGQQQRKHHSKKHNQHPFPSPSLPDRPSLLLSHLPSPVSSMSSFLLRNLNFEDDSAPVPEQLETVFAGSAMRAMDRVAELPVVELSRRWGVFLGLKLAHYSWVLGTSMLIIFFPLFVEVQREDSLNAFEQDQVALYSARGYSSYQIEAMKARGELGVNPAPPPQQPGFP